MTDPAPTKRPVLTRQSQVFFFLVLGLMVLLSWIVFRPFVIYMVTGVFVAVLALPIDRRWERIAPNRVAAFLTMFTVLLLLVLPVVAIGAALVGDAQRLSESIQSGEARARVDEQLQGPVAQGMLDLVYPNQTAEERNATLNLTVERGQAWVQEKLADFGRDAVGLLPRFFVAVTVILFVVYYVLVDGERLVEFLRRSSPLPAVQVEHILAEARNGLHAVFIGQILTSVIQGALGGIGFLVAGVPGAVLWAAVMAVFSLLPIVGAFLVWVPAGLLLLARGDVWQGVFLLLWGLIVVSQVDNFIRPKLIGDRAKIHPIFVLIGVLGGVAAFGFIGLFLGPLIVGITISLLRVWEEHYLDRGTPAPTIQTQLPAVDVPARLPDGPGGPP